MKTTLILFTGFALALAAFCADGENAFAQQKRSPPPAPSGPPNPGTMSRWKLQQDTQTQIFSIQQDVTTNRAKTSDKSFNNRDSYIRGDRSSRFNLKNLPAMRKSR
jgi:hypothetical protein